MNLPLVPYLAAVIPAFLSAIAKEHTFPTKQVIGSALLLIVLAALEAWNGQLANALAWLIAITSLIFNGPTLFNIVNKAVK